MLRYQSARALQMLDGRADPATVVPALEAQLGARDPGLRYNAARALVAIKPDSVSPEAFDGLFGDPRTEAEIDRLVAEVAAGGGARATALSRLGQIGPPAVSAVPALVSQLTHGAASDRELVAETIVEISRAALEDLVVDRPAAQRVSGAKPGARRRRPRRHRAGRGEGDREPDGGAAAAGRPDRRGRSSHGAGRARRARRAG